jgi:hypothetical protein
MRHAGAVKDLLPAGGFEFAFVQMTTPFKGLVHKDQVFFLPPSGVVRPVSNFARSRPPTCNAVDEHFALLGGAGPSSIIHQRNVH